MECKKVFKVIIWFNAQSGVVFSPHMDPNSVATGGVGGQNSYGQIGISIYFNFEHIL